MIKESSAEAEAELLSKEDALTKELREICCLVAQSVYDTEVSSLAPLKIELENKSFS